MPPAACRRLPEDAMVGSKSPKSADYGLFHTDGEKARQAFVCRICGVNLIVLCSPEGISDAHFSRFDCPACGWAFDFWSAGRIESWFLGPRFPALPTVTAQDGRFAEQTPSAPYAARSFWTQQQLVWKDGSRGFFRRSAPDA